MKLSPRLLLAGALATGALSLVGVGAHAAFTSEGVVTANASTGTVVLTMAQNGTPNCTSDGAPCTVGTGTVTNSNGVSTLTFPPVSNLGSTFSITLPFKVTNTGTLTIPTGKLFYSLVDNGLNSTNANTTLGQYTWFTITLSGPGVAPETSCSDSGSGLLSQGIPNPLGSNPGEQSSCGLSGGQSATGTLTLWSNSTGPALTASPTAPSPLPSGAQGGTMVPALTYTGSDS